MNPKKMLTWRSIERAQPSPFGGDHLGSGEELPCRPPPRLPFLPTRKRLILLERGMTFLRIVIPL